MAALWPRHDHGDRPVYEETVAFWLQSCDQMERGIRAALGGGYDAPDEASLRRWYRGLVEVYEDLCLYTLY